MWSLWMTCTLVCGVSCTIVGVPPLFLGDEDNGFKRKLYVGVSIPSLMIVVAILHYFLNTRPLRKLVGRMEFTLEQRHITEGHQRNVLRKANEVVFGNAPAIGGPATAARAGVGGSNPSLSLNYAMKHQQRLIDELGVGSYHDEVFSVNTHVKDLFQSLIREQQALYKLQIETFQQNITSGVFTNNASFSTTGGSSSPAFYSNQMVVDEVNRRADQKSALLSTDMAKSSPSPPMGPGSGVPNEIGGGNIVNSSRQRPTSLSGATISMTATNNSSHFSPTGGKGGGSRQNSVNALPFGEQPPSATGDQPPAVPSAFYNNEEVDDLEGVEEMWDGSDLTSCGGSEDDYVVAQTVSHRLSQGNLMGMSSNLGGAGGRPASLTIPRVENDAPGNRYSLASNGSAALVEVHPVGTPQNPGTGGRTFGQSGRDGSVVLEGSSIVFPPRSPQLRPAVVLTRGKRFTEDNPNITMYISHNKNENLIAYEAVWNSDTASPALDKDKPLEGYRLVLDPKSLESRKSRGKANAPARSELGMMEMKMAYGFEKKTATRYVPPPARVINESKRDSHGGKDETGSLDNGSFGNDSTTSFGEPATLTSAGSVAPAHDQFSILFKAVKKKYMVLGFDYVKLRSTLEQEEKTAVVQLIPTLKMPLSKQITHADSSFSLSSQQCIMDKIYIHTKVGGWGPVPTVEYMELHGFCVATGEKIVEQVKP